MSACGSSFLVSALLPFKSAASAIAGARTNRAIRRCGFDGPVIRIAKSAAAAPSPWRKIARRGFLLITLLSLAWCILLGVAWRMSYRSSAYEYAEGHYPEDSLLITLHDGDVNGGRNIARRGQWPEMIRERYIFHLSCGVSTYTGPNNSSWSFRLPMWLPTALTAILPALWLAVRPARMRRRRSERGLCANCGYDLRASPGRCPECGVTTVVV
jgi:hypothetical protein